MSKKLTLTVDPSRADPTKLLAILRTNPPPRTSCRRHSRTLILAAMCFYEGRLRNIPVHPEAAIYHIIHHNYID